VTHLFPSRNVPNLVDRVAFRRTMRILESRYQVPDWTRGMSPFEVLISTVLSQSTTMANERWSLENLRRAVGAITPEQLADTPAKDIARAIWHAGLSRQKAPRIRAIAAAIRDRWGGRVERILALSTEQARAELMALPGVGPKTADVVLSMTGGHPTFPVDTHIARIAGRWNLSRRKDYESIRAALERWTPPDKRKAWHLAIIAHGRTLCKARSPRCSECPVRQDCDWYRRSQGRERRSRGRPARTQERIKNGGRS
jgi:endonuclease III